METALLIDFGSTYTKVTAVDVKNALLLGTASSYTTVETDIGKGLDDALAKLYEKSGVTKFDHRLACSSAAGGLRMAVSGLVPGLTSEAARLASLGAGAKVIKIYSFQLTAEDIIEIERLKPDIFLLTGGIDGGDVDCIIHNAKMLADCKQRFPVILAGNRTAVSTCSEALKGWEVSVCPNVMPKLGELNIDPVQSVIRELFLKNIVQARGLSKAEELVAGILMPTPVAVLKAMKLLAEGTKNRSGIGELAGIDLGGATTDVYSIAEGNPKTDDTFLKGLREPYEKRTVEGDIGMRYSAAGVADAVGMEHLQQLSGLLEDEVQKQLDQIQKQPGILAVTPAQKAFDDALAAAAIEVAMSRHAGTLEEVYTPMGQVFAQSGKDLRNVRNLVLTGGAIIHNESVEKVAAHALFKPGLPISLKPKQADIYVDKQYILAAMGLLSEIDPDAAYQIMEKELVRYGAGE